MEIHIKSMQNNLFIHIEIVSKFLAFDFQVESDSNWLAGQVYLELQVNLRILCYPLEKS